MKNNKGITLVEIILTIAIMLIIFQAIYSLFFVGTKSFNMSKDKGFAQQNVRIAADYITKELRTAAKITTIAPQDTIYYSLSLDSSKNLIRTKYDNTGSSSNKIVTLEEIFFINSKDNDGNIKKGFIKVNTSSQENSQENNLEFEILLENLLEFNTEIPQNTSTIFYTKY